MDAPADRPAADAREAFLVLGAGGMLGTAMRRVLGARGAAFEAFTHRELDIIDAEAVRAACGRFAEGGAGIVVNAAAYTDVERAEDEPEAAYRVNEHGARVVAEAAREAGLALVHVSTDFVFDGRKGAPYVEDDEPNPLSAYGASKLAGERAVRKAWEAPGAHPDALVVRTAWVYGPGGEHFVTKILRAARERGIVRAVDDQRGSPTYTLDLARGIVSLVDAGAAGLFHLAGGGDCTRFELATEALRLAGVDVPVEPVASSAFATKATRPADSVLDCSKAAALGVRMPEWRDALGRYVSEHVGADA